METSSLNWLFRKQSSQHSQFPPRDPHPALALFQNVLRTNWRGFLGLALPHRSSVGSAAAEQRLQGLFGHCRDCPSSQQRQQLCPEPWGAEGTASPDPQKGKIPNGFHLCPNNHIAPTTLWKNPRLDSPTCSVLHGVQPTQKPPLHLSEEQKMEPEWGRAGAGSSSGVSKAAAAQRSLQYRNCLVMWLET